jgi:hypothetical protein
MHKRLYIFLVQLRTTTRRRAISTYVGSISIPRYRRPVSFAARQVVPEPAKGSSMSSPGALLFSMR